MILIITGTKKDAKCLMLVWRHSHDYHRVWQRCCIGRRKNSWQLSLDMTKRKPDKYNALEHWLQYSVHFDVNTEIVVRYCLFGEQQSFRRHLPRHSTADSNFMPVVRMYQQTFHK